MYSDVKKSSLPLFLITVLILGVLLFVGARAIEKSRENIRENGVIAIQSAIEKTAVQCFAVEGAYPSDIEYLENNYGLKVNRDDYIIVYEAFASNVMPEIRVVKKS